MKSLLLTGALGALVTSAAFGAVSLNVSQVGSDVVASFSGTINLSALEHRNGGEPVDVVSRYGVGQSDQTLSIGSAGFFDPFGAISGPTAFLTGTEVEFTAPDASSGDLFGIWASVSDIWVPESYVSGSALAGSSTWFNTTVQDLGFVTGTYTWTWGVDDTADSLTVTVVPEPSSIAVLAGTAVLGFVGVRRRRS